MGGIEDDPPTDEQIAAIRKRVRDHLDENGEGTPAYIFYTCTQFMSRYFKYRFFLLFDTSCGNSQFYFCGKWLTFSFDVLLVLTIFIGLRLQSLSKAVFYQGLPFGVN